MRRSISHKNEKDSPTFERALESLGNLFRPHPELQSLLEAEADRLLSAKLPQADSYKCSYKSPPNPPAIYSSLQRPGALQSWLHGLARKRASSMQIVRCRVSRVIYPRFPADSA
jgi:hypothetical protein